MHNAENGGPTSTNFFSATAHWLASQCEGIKGAQSGVLVLGPPDVGPFTPVGFWPSGQTSAPRLSDVAEHALGDRVVCVEALPPDTVGLAVPISVDGYLQGVFALEVLGRSDIEVQHIVQRMRQAVGWVENWIRSQESSSTLASEERLMGVLDILAAVLGERKFEAACQTLVTELALRLQCDRVSFGLTKAQHVRVLALSHSSQFGKRMNLVHSVGAAMDEAIDQRATVRFPAESEDEILVTRDHEKLAAEHGSGSILTVPMAGAQNLTAALVFERPASMPFTQSDVEFSQSVAAVLGRILELQKQNDRALLLRVGDALSEQAIRLLGPRYAKRKLLVLVIVGLTVFFHYAQGDFRVTAPAKLNGAVRRTLAAPFDGYVLKASARAGDVVREGDQLAALDDREMRLERLKWASQYEQYVKQHREAVATRDRAKSLIVQSLYEQARAQVEMLDSQLKRVVIVAPFPGVIVKGDLSQSLGSAVKRGDSLFEITPLSAYRVIVEVDERDIAHVVQGQHGRLILSSITKEAFPFEIGNVTSVTTAREGRNFFRVEAMLEDASDRLRPGMEGVAKIEIDQRGLWWIWTRQLSDWVRLFIWTYWP